MSDSDAPPPEGPRPALAEARLDRRLRLTARCGWLAASCGLVLIVLAVVGFGRLDQHYLDAQAELDRYPGTIERVTDASGESSSGEAVVQFTEAGIPRAVAIHVGDVHRWEDRRSVTVLVDPSTRQATLPGENYRPEWVVTVALIVGLTGVVALAVGATMVHRARTRRRRLGSSPWWRTEAYLGTQPGERARHYAYLPAWDRDRVWKCTGLASSVVRDADTAPLPLTVDFAGDEARIVIRVVGNDALVIGDCFPLAAPERLRVLRTTRGEVAGALLRTPSGDTAFYAVSRTVAADALVALRAGDTVMARQGPGSLAVLVIGEREEVAIATRGKAKAPRSRPSLTS